MTSFLFYVATLVALVGLLCALRPLPRLRLRTRRVGFFVLLVGVTGAIGAMLWPHRLTPSDTPGMQLDAFMPEYHFNEVHSISVQAPPERVYQTIRQVKPSEIRLLSTLFWLRSLGGCKSNDLEASERSVLAELVAQGFVQLGEISNRELVLGVIGQFWRVQGGTHRVESASEFLTFASPGYAKAAINFLVVDAGNGTSKVVTETRILTTDETSRRRFGWYWRQIGRAHV